MEEKLPLPTKTKIAAWWMIIEYSSLFLLITIAGFGFTPEFLFLLVPLLFCIYL
jgi:hypothetical protein